MFGCPDGEIVAMLGGIVLEELQIAATLAAGTTGHLIETCGLIEDSAAIDVEIVACHYSSSY